MTERKVDDPDVVLRLMVDDPVDGVNHIAREAAARVIQHAHVDERRARGDPAGIGRRDARRRARLAHDDAGDVRAVAEGVGRVRVAGDEAHIGDDL